MVHSDQVMVISTCSWLITCHNTDEHDYDLSLHVYHLQPISATNFDLDSQILSVSNNVWDKNSWEFT